MYRLRRLLVAGAALFALLLLGPASQFVHARGGTWHGFVYHGQAGSRPYFVYTPVNYHPGTPVPLIVMLHGCTQTAADFAAGTQMDELADAHRFIVLYPQQTTLANPATCWNWFVPANQRRGSGEPSILAGMVEAVERSWNDSTGQEVQEYWVAVGASHVWTGGSPRGTFTDPLGPDLSQILYRFFLNHPLSRLDKHLFSG